MLILMILFNFDGHECLSRSLIYLIEVAPALRKCNAEKGKSHLIGKQAKKLSFFRNTRSYGALRAADLDWIIGPGYSLGGYILEKKHEKLTWNHEKS